MGIVDGIGVGVSVSSGSGDGVRTGSRSGVSNDSPHQSASGAGRGCVTVVVQGGSGSGKTTFGAVLVGTLLMRRSEGGAVPRALFVSLPRVQHVGGVFSVGGIVEYIRHELDISESEFDGLRDEGVVLVLDSLDEVCGSDAIGKCDGGCDLIGLNGLCGWDSLCVVITSRDELFGDVDCCRVFSGDVRSVYISPFDEEQAGEYVGNAVSSGKVCVYFVASRGCQQADADHSYLVPTGSRCNHHLD